ncbi:MAG: cysteine hydrolase family protein [Alphaproteobacteria bacterium]|nr:cysteine hydrolase family protein [Alphaproteobacteria bacterium]
MVFDKHSALILIDLQQAIDHPRWGRRNNPGAESRIGSVLEAWRQAGLPVFHVQHLSTESDSPYRPDQPGCAFKPELAPRGDEPVVQKQVTSAFVGTDLAERLRGQGIEALVVAGVLAHNSVDATIRHGANLGFSMTLLADGCWSVDILDARGYHWPAEVVHAVTLAVLEGEYADIAHSTDVLDALSAALIRRPKALP